MAVVVRFDDVEITPARLPARGFRHPVEAGVPAPALAAPEAGLRVPDIAG